MELWAKVFRRWTTRRAAGVEMSCAASRRRETSMSVIDLMSTEEDSERVEVDVVDLFSRRKRV
jgi:hypothetical protein